MNCILFKQTALWIILIYHSFSWAKETVSVEFLGLAIPGSINYEFNLLHTLDCDLNQGVGVGYGYQIQLTTTCLWFRGFHHLETGIATKLPWNGPTAILPAVSFNIGYRYEKGIVFRVIPQIVYLIPYSGFPYGNRIIPWIAVSIGWAFDGPITWIQRTPTTLTAAPRS